MIISIHQPNYLPWLGYFYKISKSDIFVILDNVQFTKGGFQNRCAIKTPQGLNWLTQPVLTKNKSNQLTNEVVFNPTEKWIEKHLKTIEMNYKKAQYFDNYFKKLENIYNAKNWSFLSDFNTQLIRCICNEFKFKAEIISSTDLNLEGKSDDLLIKICKKLGANCYISGKGGAKYQSVSKFTDAGITLTYSDFTHPTYKQCWGDFVPNASIIDLLFNVGPQASLFS